MVGYSKKSALLEEAITHMNAGRYGRSSTALKELLALDPHNTEARRLFATLHLRLGSLVTARQAFESLVNEAIERQDLWLAESLLREYLAAGPRCVPFLELLAHVYEEKGDVMAAVAELGKAIDILIEDPDSENLKKPLSALCQSKSACAGKSCGLSVRLSLRHTNRRASCASSDGSCRSDDIGGRCLAHPQGDILATTEESRASSDVMPWEQFDGVPPNQETPPPPFVESRHRIARCSERGDRPGTARCGSEELEVPLSESIGSIRDANGPYQDVAPSILTEPPFQLNGHRDDEMGDPTVDRPPFVEEELAPSCSETPPGNVEKVSVSSVGSPGLSSPMPWEQIENSTIRIEETATAPLAQPEGASLLSDESVLATPATTQPESVSESVVESSSCAGSDRA